MTSPVGSNRLIQVLNNLNQVDIDVLRRLEEHRYLQTDQVARFEFPERPTHSAAVRAAHRALKRLRTFGLISMLDRTIGGATRGSSAAVWTLTNTGLRASLLAAGGGQQPRRRLSEPTLIFLRHEVAVAELHLRILDAVAEADADVRSLELEPLCWRRYLGPLGAMAILKPDLATEIDTTDFELSHFWEADRATEPPHRIIAKCLQYQEYYRSGEEERRGRMLPLVVWVVPTEPRRQQLGRHLTRQNGIDPRLHRVILMSEVTQLVADDEAVGRLPEGEVSHVE